MKNRWIALYVENQVGVLAKVSGLFSGKSYNLQSLTVGTTEDATVSRMTICVTSDDITFEQIKKQLNRLVEVIKVIDLTNERNIICKSKRNRIGSDRRNIPHCAGISCGSGGHRRRQRDARMQADGAQKQRTDRTFKFKVSQSCGNCTRGSGRDRGDQHIVQIRSAADR